MSSDDVETALKKQLQSLLGDDILDYIRNPDWDLRAEKSEAQQKNNARTEKYKFNQAKMRAPDSEAVRIATSNITLQLIAQKDVYSDNLRKFACKQLIDAGYDATKSKEAIDRLVTHHDQLKRNWQMRSRFKLSRVIIEQLRAIEGKRNAS